MHIQLYLLLETGSKPNIGFVFAITDPSFGIKTPHLPKEKKKKKEYLPQVNPIPLSTLNLHKTWVRHLLLLIQQSSENVYKKDYCVN